MGQSQSMGQSWTREADYDYWPHYSFLRANVSTLSYFRKIVMDQVYLPLFRFSKRYGIIRGKQYEICDQAMIKGKSLKELSYMTITGKQLKEIIGDMPLLKFMFDNDQHYGMKYRTGVNEDLLEFKNDDMCSSGGIYVTTLDNFNHYCGHYGSYARRVHIEDDALIYVEDKKLKCNKVTLSEREPNKDLIRKLFLEYVSNKNNEEILKLICRAPRLCEFIPINDSTEGVIIEAIRLNQNVFEFLNKSQMTPRIVMEVIDNDGTLIRFIDSDSITNEMIIRAVKQNGSAIAHVDKKIRTPEIIMLAVKQCGNVIQYLDDDEMTPDIVLEAIEQDNNSFSYLAKKHRTPEIIMKAVKKDGLVIEFLDNDEKTQKIITDAVKQNGSAIRYVAHSLRTEKIIIEAMKQCGLAIRYIDKSEKTQKIIIAAINQDKDAIEYVTKSDMMKMIIDNFVEKEITELDP